MPIEIEINGETLTLSSDQELALSACLDELHESREAVLAGAAGTGKTTVMRAVLNGWDGPVMFVAPTGKAAVRLSEQTGMGTRTIHSSIFGAVQEEEDENNARREKLRFGELRPPEGCTPSTLMVVDEASMVDNALASQFREAIEQVGASILWVGDHEQLPPVAGSPGVNLANPTARLTQVHRQALESPVLDLATCIRERNGGAFTRWGDEVTRQHGTIEQAVEWAEGSSDRVLLTWTNKVRKTANRLTRKSRGYGKDVEVGETLICTFNNHNLGIMNGETFEVESIEKHEDMSTVLGFDVIWVKPVGRRDRFLMVPSTFDAYQPRLSDRRIYTSAFSVLWTKGDSLWEMLDETGLSLDRLRTLRTEYKESGVQGTWGYCLTVHKSQGSQWGEVGFISCPGFRDRSGRLNAEDRRRMTYTAVTRAERGFHAFMLQVMPDYRRSNPYAAN